MDELHTSNYVLPFNPSKNLVFQFDSYLWLSRAPAEKYLVFYSHLCLDCLDYPVSHLDGQESLLSCQGNSNLRLGRPLSDIKQELEYYRKVIERRTEKYGG